MSLLHKKTAEKPKEKTAPAPSKGPVESDEITDTDKIEDYHESDAEEVAPAKHEVKPASADPMADHPKFQKWK